MDQDQDQARAWLVTAVEEARAGLAEGGIPIGAALYGPDGALLGLMPMDTIRSALFIVTGLAGIAIGMANRRSLPPPPSGNGDMRFWM